MKAALYTLYLKTKLDIKSTEILIAYYLIPLLFFGIMGAVFTTIMPESKQTIIASMTIFSITMGALFGTPGSILEYFKNDIRKSLKSAGIPMGAIVVSNILSGLVNLIVVSVIIFILSPLVFDAVKPVNMWVYLSGFFLFLLATLLIGNIVGLLAKSSSQLTLYSQIIFLPSMMLSGIMFPSEMLPKSLAYLGLIFPATHGMKILSSDSFIAKHYLFLLFFILLGLMIIKWKLQQLRYEDVR
ncbi:ABC transporter permease [Amphibacillus sp. Q70]|uniref:ABC transporter permease n=1 Tax=Amphibacillus sp. Q70 TaxID=3453416 RepID=UPI003F855608